MAAKLHYRDGGLWRTAAALHYRDAGTWRNLKSAWYRDGGIWRQVFSAAGPVSLFDGEYINYSRSGATATASVTFETDGSLTDSGVADRMDGVEAGVKWFDPITPGIGSGYWIQANGGAWQQISAARSFSVAQSTAGIASVSYAFNIAASSGGAVLASGTITVEAERY